jgi:hypothetical protein
MPVFVGMSGASRFTSRKIDMTRGYRSAGPRFLVEARHGFGVVVVDLRRRVQNRGYGPLVALEVRHQDFDRTRRHALVNEPDGLGEDTGAEVREVVAVHGRDDRRAGGS